MKIYRVRYTEYDGEITMEHWSQCFKDKEEAERKLVELKQNVSEDAAWLYEYYDKEEIVIVDKPDRYFVTANGSCFDYEVTVKEEYLW